MAKPEQTPCLEAATKSLHAQQFDTTRNGALDMLCKRLRRVLLREAAPPSYTLQGVQAGCIQACTKRGMHEMNAKCKGRCGRFHGDALVGAKK